MADITREGYLFQWDMPKLPACQTEWPSFRHDPQQSGNYDRDGTPPNAPAGLTVHAGSLRFTAPGDDYGCGTATSFQIATSDQPIDATRFADATQLSSPPAPAPAGTKQSYELPAHGRYVAIRAIDDAGNVGPTASLDTQPGGGGHHHHPPCGNAIRGDFRANQLRGTRFGDRIRGLGGADRIRARRGRDCLFGGGGRDELNGGSGADRLKGGHSADLLRGAAGRDRLVGDTGGDRLDGGRGGDRILAATGDRVRAGRGNDRIKVRGRHGVKVDCGLGRRDVAIVRRGAHLQLSGCETVRHPH
jgi:hypothetical protein